MGRFGDPAEPPGNVQEAGGRGSELQAAVSAGDGDGEVDPRRTNGRWLQGAPGTHIDSPK